MATDSEQFHQSALQKIIEQMEPTNNSGNVTTISDNSLMQMMSQTTLTNTNNANASNAFEQNVTNNKKTVRKFNLNQFIHDAVYPAECSDSDDEAKANDRTTTDLFDASYQVDHVRASQRSVDLNATTVCDELNETIVDEELIVSLSQKVDALNESLNAEDCGLLEILRQLEEQEEDDDDSGAIEDDSALAPLTQTTSVQQRLSQKQSQEAAAAAAIFNASILQGIDQLLGDEDPFAGGDSDDENDTRDKLMNKTMVSDDCKQLIDSDDDLWNEFSMTFDLDDVADRR